MRNVINKDNSLSYECNWKNVRIASCLQRLNKTKFVCFVYLFISWNSASEKRCWQDDDGENGRNIKM